MFAEDNKRIVRRFVEEMLSGHNLAVADQLFTADFIDHDADDPDGHLSGVEGARAEVGAFLAAFPDMRVTVDDLIAEGEKVVLRGTLRGTHGGDLQGLPPTGKQVTIWAWQTYRLSGGKIAEAWLHVDRLGLLQQVGALPAPARAVAPTA